MKSKKPHGIGSKEIKRSRETKCDKGLVQILGTVFQVTRIRERVIPAKEHHQKP